MTFPHWHNFTEFTPVIPALYWDVESEEQRTKALCKQLCKLINYAAKMGIAIDELQEQVTEIFDGRLDDFITAKIEEWFQENQPELYNDVQDLLNRVTRLEGGYIAVCGDSFSDTYAEWPGKLASRMNMQLINKAVAGSGFIYTGRKTIVQQFLEVCADENIDKVSYIIVYGGINDWRYAPNHEPSDYTTAFETIRDAYQNLSHKPKLVFCFGNAARGNTPFYNGYDIWANRIQAHALSVGLPSVFNVQYWLLFVPESVYGNDGIHPNAKGESIIGSYMQNIIMGGYSGVHRSYRVEGLNGCSDTSSFAEFVFDNGMLNITVRLGESGDTVSGFNDQSGVQLCQLPEALYYKLGGYGQRNMDFPPMATYTYQGSTLLYAPTLYLSFAQYSRSLRLLAQANGYWSYGYTALKNGNFIVDTQNATGVVTLRTNMTGGIMSGRI